MRTGEVNNHKGGIAILTVIIGSSGPKISSVMIAASSGGSNRIVGSMNLKSLQNKTDKRLQRLIILLLGPDQQKALLNYKLQARGGRKKADTTQSKKSELSYSIQKTD